MTKADSRKKNCSTFIEDLIENLPIGMMLLDKYGRIIKINKKQEEASQISREKILGKTFEEAFPGTLEQGLKAPYFKLLRKGFPFDVIIDRYIPQYYSNQMTYHARGASFFNKKYFILLHELDEELYQEKRLVEKRTSELRESKKFLESLINASPIIIIGTDLINRIVLFNTIAEKTFGYMEEDILGRKMNFLFKNRLPNKNKSKERTCSPTAREVLCIKKNQNTFKGSILATDIKDSVDKTIAKLYLINDLTEKKEMEERLLLSEKLALYSELMGGIAHQLNNPLIGVVNFSEILLKETSDEDPKRELVETVSKAARECLRITTSVLHSIKDANRNFRKTDIHEILTNSLQSLSGQFGENLKKISIMLKMDKNVLPIEGNEIQLKQCFLNILTNAVQAMQNGGSLKIRTGYDEKKKTVEIVFSDNGIGIPKEHLSKILLPFFSLNKSSGRHGLGLSFANQIIKNHKGCINIESEEGLGSTFTIILPTSQNKSPMSAEV